MEGDINMSRNLDILKIERLRQTEEELRGSWKDEKNISHHIFEIFFQFPFEPRALNLNRDQEDLYDRKLKRIAEDYQDIRIKRNDLLIRGKKSFSCTVSLIYGRNTKAIINLRVFQVVEEIINSWEKYFGVVKIKMVTQFQDNSFASAKGIQLKVITGKTPKLEGEV